MKKHKHPVCDTRLRAVRKGGKVVEYLCCCKEHHILKVK